MMIWRTAALTIALVTHAIVAFAADVQMHYLLDARALRTVDAASTVDIGLFTDRDCTVGVFHTTLVLGDVDLLVRVPATVLRGAAKPTKMAELRHVLHGAPAVAPLYARITGAGVTPIDTACQVQSIPAPPANTPTLIDATGTVLGPFGVMTDFSGRPVWMRSSGDLTYTVSVDTALYGTDWQLYFEAPGCASAPLIYADYYSLELAYGSVSHGATLYYPVGAPTQRSVSSYSWYAATPADCQSGTFAPPDHCCQAVVPGPTFTASFIATATTTDLVRFVPPFRVELR